VPNNRGHEASIAEGENVAQMTFPHGGKRNTRWVGYKLHLTETCDAGQPGLITRVLTTPAMRFKLSC
jgi:hypothetical protein